MLVTHDRELAKRTDQVYLIKGGQLNALSHA
ncbi:hypothetical protein A3SI_01121 [Nitritalea halalkaliphila LW7]|uniref:ABC transporter n=1 Tax=Nitritalea halalkaliphila LW7 TaxID=1189621 RepID=I5CA08_9BACT|nr:hypothetical protein A3SI_01121 [Nitritalea halalkaliphila LW7]